MTPWDEPDHAVGGTRELAIREEMERRLQARGWELPPEPPVMRVPCAEGCGRQMLSASPRCAVCARRRSARIRRPRRSVARGYRQRPSQRHQAQNSYLARQLEHQMLTPEELDAASRQRFGGEGDGP